MKKLFLLFFVAILFVGCARESENISNVSDNSYPKLKVVNKINTTSYITKVSLVGYEFSPLEIRYNESQTFILKDGMVGGYDDIVISVLYGTVTTTTSSCRIRKDFADGKTTTVTLVKDSGESSLPRLE